MIRGTCEFCGKDVTTAELAAFPVKGWELERTQGGANRILDRKREPNRIAHASCAEHHARHGGQTGLFG